MSSGITQNEAEAAEEWEDDGEILEESPCGRWLKRPERVEQRDVPGIDDAYLAMDTEEGMEVAWNEVRFSERKNFKAQESKIRAVFENLTRLEHPNIVKFHRYWTDTHDDKPRVIFITELMSSGSLKQFLRRMKHNAKELSFQVWRKWCTQILSALSYLHSCRPPIVHGNLTCETVFIQHNGLLKIGSVAPDVIHHHVKTCYDTMKNTVCVAPEFGEKVSPAVDIYSFGVCALEMATLETYGSGDGMVNITYEDVREDAEACINDERQRDFILKCITPNPNERPTARQLLLHPALFEVPSLKLLASYAVVRMANGNVSEMVEDALQNYTPETVVLAVSHSNLDSGSDSCEIVLTVADVEPAEKIEKFVEDVRIGIYPLTVYKLKEPPQIISRPLSPELTDSRKSSTPEPMPHEKRRIINMMCSVRPKNGGSELAMTVLLRMEDKMNRQLSCSIAPSDSASSLAHELVYHGFINKNDRDRVGILIEEALRGGFLDDSDYAGSPE